jgi:hypothetical protein
LVVIKFMNEREIYLRSGLVEDDDILIN